MSTRVCLGCGATPCAPCAAKAARIGAVARLDPRFAAAVPALDLALDTFGFPEPLQAGLHTAVGIATPLSPQDAQDFARLVQTWAEIDKVYFDPNTRGSLKSQIAAARKNWGAFENLWNAAQRDPTRLREQLRVADSLLAAIESGKGAREVVTEKVSSLPRSVVLLSVGVVAAVVGGTVAFVAGRK